MAKRQGLHEINTFYDRDTLSNLKLWAKYENKSLTKFVHEIVMEYYQKRKYYESFSLIKENKPQRDNIPIDRKNPISRLMANIFNM